MTGYKQNRGLTEKEKHKLLEQYMGEGYAPSEIDKELNLPKDYTHDYWVALWQSNFATAYLKRACH